MIVPGTTRVTADVVGNSTASSGDSAMAPIEKERWLTIGMRLFVQYSMVKGAVPKLAAALGTVRRVEAE